MPGLRLEPDGSVLRVEEAGARLEAVLLAPGSAGSDRSRLLGAAWRDAQGGVRFGWPMEPGRTFDGLTDAAAPAAVLLPAALALVAALRRAGPGLGSRCLVSGEGLAARLARAVAADFGLRDASASGEAAAGTRPALVVLTGSGGSDLEDDLRRVEDGGRVIALGAPDGAPAIDFYPDVHRRGLSLDLVPWRPEAGDAAALWQRGRARLERLVVSIGAAATGPPLVEDGAGWRLGRAAPGWSVHAPRA